MTKYYQPEIECASREEILALQNERLVKQVQHVWDNVPYYRKKMEEKGLTPADIQSVDDLHKLPFLTKDDLRECYPYGLLAKPLADCVRIQSTSGTTGKRVVAFYTQHDIDLWEECCARAIVAAGGTNEDVCHVSYGYGLFTGGPGLNGGSHKVGCLTIPTSSGNTERQIKLMRDFNVKGFCSVVSYVPRLIEKLDADPTGNREIPSLKVGIFGSETFSDETRHRIESRLGIECFDIYGMTETGGIGTTGQDCQCHAGLHVFEDQYITEVIDPVTGKVLPDGEYGELVFTSLQREAMPILRYRTHDICRILTRETCACGRTSLRIDRITGRTDDMLIVKGVNFYPRQVEQALMEIPGVKDEFQIILEDHNGMTDVTVNVEAEPGVTGHTVAKHLKERLGFLPKGEVFPVGALPRTEGKAKRVIRKSV